MTKKRHRYQDEFDGSLGHNAARSGHLMRQETERCLEGLGVTPEQWQALVYLQGYDEEDGLTQNELAGITLKDKTTISRLVEAMLKSGLLARHAGSDRRTYRLHLSERGKQVVAEAWPRIMGHYDRHVFAALDTDERATLLALMQKVRRGLNDM